MKKKKQKVQIFKLEERVLFDGAAAAEIVAAVNNAGEADNADQADSNDSDQDRQQEKFIQNTVQNAGPVDMPVPDANVQNDGEGLPQADAAQNDPAEVLINGNADFSQPVDVSADADADADNLQVSADIDADAVDQADLIVLDQDAADRLDLDVLDGKNVLVLDGDSDAADQIEDWMNDHDDQDVDHVLFVSDSDSQDIQLDHAELDTLSIDDFQSSLDQDASDDLVIMPDRDSVFTVNADADELPAELTQDAAADRHELVILNSTTAGLDNVLDQLGDSREVLVIDSTSDLSGLEQVENYLAEHDNVQYDAVHIMTHGDDTGIILGSNFISDANDFSVFSDHIAADGDLMLYGCSMASSEAGQSFLQSIADASGADVAASTDITGSAALGGNWNLEYTIGEITSQTITLDSTWNFRFTDIHVTGTESATTASTIQKALDGGSGGSGESYWTRPAATGTDVIILDVPGGSATISISGITIQKGNASGSGTYTLNGSSSSLNLTGTGFNVTVTGQGDYTLTEGSSNNGSVTTSGKVTINGTQGGNVSGFSSLTVGTDGTVGDLNIGTTEALAGQTLDISGHAGNVSVGTYSTGTVHVSGTDSVVGNIQFSGKGAMTLADGTVGNVTITSAATGTVNISASALGNVQINSTNGAQVTIDLNNTADTGYGRMGNARTIDFADGSDAHLTISGGYFGSQFSLTTGENATGGVEISGGTFHHGSTITLENSTENDLLISGGIFHGDINVNGGNFSVDPDTDIYTFEHGLRVTGGTFGTLDDGEGHSYISNITIGNDNGDAASLTGGTFANAKLTLNNGYLSMNTSLTYDGTVSAVTVTNGKAEFDAGSVINVTRSSADGIRITGGKVDFAGKVDYTPEQLPNGNFTISTKTGISISSGLLRMSGDIGKTDSVRNFRTGLSVSGTGTAFIYEDSDIFGHDTAISVSGTGKAVMYGGTAAAASWAEGWDGKFATGVNVGTGAAFTFLGGTIKGNIVNNGTFNYYLNIDGSSTHTLSDRVFYANFRDLEAANQFLSWYTDTTTAIHEDIYPNVDFTVFHSGTGNYTVSSGQNVAFSSGVDANSYVAGFLGKQLARLSGKDIKTQTALDNLIASIVADGFLIPGDGPVTWTYNADGTVTASAGGNVLTGIVAMVDADNPETVYYYDSVSGQIFSSSKFTVVAGGSLTVARESAAKKTSFYAVGANVAGTMKINFVESWYADFNVSQTGSLTIGVPGQTNNNANQIRNSLNDSTDLLVNAGKTYIHGATFADQITNSGEMDITSVIINGADPMNPTAIDNTGTLKLSGTGSKILNAGGVFNHKSGTVEITGSNITINAPYREDIGSDAHSGGIFSESGTITIKEGANIHFNTDNGILIAGGELKMEGGTLTGNGGNSTAVVLSGIWKGFYSQETRLYTVNPQDTESTAVMFMTGGTIGNTFGTSILVGDDVNPAGDTPSKAALVFTGGSVASVKNSGSLFLRGNGIDAIDNNAAGRVYIGVTVTDTPAAVGYEFASLQDAVDAVASGNAAAYNIGGTVDDDHVLGEIAINPAYSGDLSVSGNIANIVAFNTQQVLDSGLEINSLSASLGNFRPLYQGSNLTFGSSTIQFALELNDSLLTSGTEVVSLNGTEYITYVYQGGLSFLEKDATSSGTDGDDQIQFVWVTLTVKEGNNLVTRNYQRVGDLVVMAPNQLIDMTGLHPYLNVYYDPETGNYYGYDTRLDAQSNDQYRTMTQLAPASDVFYSRGVQSDTNAKTAAADNVFDELQRNGIRYKMVADSEAYGGYDFRKYAKVQIGSQGEILIGSPCADGNPIVPNYADPAVNQGSAADNLDAKITYAGYQAGGSVLKNGCEITGTRTGKDAQGHETTETVTFIYRCIDGRVRLYESNSTAEYGVSIEVTDTTTLLSDALFANVSLNVTDGGLRVYNDNGAQVLFGGQKSTAGGLEASTITVDSSSGLYIENGEIEMYSGASAFIRNYGVMWVDQTSELVLHASSSQETAGIDNFGTVCFGDGDTDMPAVLRQGGSLTIDGRDVVGIKNEADATFLMFNGRVDARGTTRGIGLNNAGDAAFIAADNYRDAVTVADLVSGDYYTTYIKGSTYSVYNSRSFQVAGTELAQAVEGDYRFVDSLGFETIIENGGGLTVDHVSTAALLGNVVTTGATNASEFHLDNALIQGSLTILRDQNVTLHDLKLTNTLNNGDGTDAGASRVTVTGGFSQSNLVSLNQDVKNAAGTETFLSKDTYVITNVGVVNRDGTIFFGTADENVEFFNYNRTVDAAKQVTYTFTNTKGRLELKYVGPNGNNIYGTLTNASGATVVFDNSAVMDPGSDYHVIPATFWGSQQNAAAIENAGTMTLKDVSVINLKSGSSALYNNGGNLTMSASDPDNSPVKVSGIHYGLRNTGTATLTNVAAVYGGNYAVANSGTLTLDVTATDRQISISNDDTALGFATDTALQALLASQFYGIYNTAGTLTIVSDPSDPDAAQGQLVMSGRFHGTDKGTAIRTSGGTVTIRNLQSKLGTDLDNELAAHLPNYTDMVNNAGTTDITLNFAVASQAVKNTSVLTLRGWNDARYTWHTTLDNYIEAGWYRNNERHVFSAGDTVNFGGTDYTYDGTVWKDADDNEIEFSAGDQVTFRGATYTLEDSQKYAADGWYLAGDNTALAPAVNDQITVDGTVYTWKNADSWYDSDWADHAFVNGDTVIFDGEEYTYDGTVWQDGSGNEKAFETGDAVNFEGHKFTYVKDAAWLNSSGEVKEFVSGDRTNLGQYYGWIYASTNDGVRVGSGSTLNLYNFGLASKATASQADTAIVTVDNGGRLNMENDSQDTIELNPESGNAIVNNGTVTIRRVTVDMGGNTARFLTNNGTATLNDVIIENGNMDKGGAIRIDGGTVNITGSDTYYIGTGIRGSQFNSNQARSAEGKGGAIYVASNSGLNINGYVTFDSNHAVWNSDAGFRGEGGTIYNDGGTVTATGSGDGYSLIFSNSNADTSAENGGFLYNASGNMTVSKASFIGGVAGVRGGVVYAAGGNVTLNNVLMGITLDETGGEIAGGNRAVYGGAIYNSGATVTVESSRIARNQAVLSNDGNGGNGGAVYNDGGTIGISGTLIYSNSADGQGGALYMEHGTATLANVSVDHNTAIDGNAIYLAGDLAGKVRVDVVNSTIAYNGFTPCVFDGTVWRDADGNEQVFTDGDKAWFDGTVECTFDGTNWIDAEDNVIALEEGARLDFQCSSGTDYAIRFSDDSNATLYLVDSTIALNYNGIYNTSANSNVWLVNSILLNDGVNVNDNPQNIHAVYTLTRLGSGLTPEDVFASSYAVTLLDDDAPMSDVFSSWVEDSHVLELNLSESNPAFKGTLAAYGPSDDKPYLYLDRESGLYKYLDGSEYGETADRVIGTDQRGTSRTLDMGVYTIGALAGVHESEYIVVTTRVDAIDPFDGKTSLREAIMTVNQNGVGTILFNTDEMGTSAGVSVISLTDTLPEFSDGVTVHVDGSLDPATFQARTEAVTIIVDSSEISEPAFIFTKPTGSVTVNALTLRGANTLLSVESSDPENAMAVEFSNVRFITSGNQAAVVAGENSDLTLTGVTVTAAALGIESLGGLTLAGTVNIESGSDAVGFRGIKVSAAGLNITGNVTVSNTQQLHSDYTGIDAFAAFTMEEGSSITVSNAASVTGKFTGIKYQAAMEPEDALSGSITIENRTLGSAGDFTGLWINGESANPTFYDLGTVTVLSHGKVAGTFVGIDVTGGNTTAEFSGAVTITHDSGSESWNVKHYGIRTSTGSTVTLADAAITMGGHYAYDFIYPVATYPINYEWVYQGEGSGEDAGKAIWGPAADVIYTPSNDVYGIWNEGTLTLNGNQTISAEFSSRQNRYNDPDEESSAYFVKTTPSNNSFTGIYTNGVTTLNGTTSIRATGTGTNMSQFLKFTGIDVGAAATVTQIGNVAISNSTGLGGAQLNWGAGVEWRDWVYDDEFWSFFNDDLTQHNLRIQDPFTGIRFSGAGTYAAAGQLEIQQQGVISYSANVDMDALNAAAFAVVDSGYVYSRTSNFYDPNGVESITLVDDVGYSISASGIAGSGNLTISGAAVNIANEGNTDLGFTGINQTTVSANTDGSLQIQNIATGVLGGEFTGLNEVALSVGDDTSAGSVTIGNSGTAAGFTGMKDGSVTIVSADSSMSIGNTHALTGRFAGIDGTVLDLQNGSLAVANSGAATEFLGFGGSGTTAADSTFQIANSGAVSGSFLGIDATGDLTLSNKFGLQNSGAVTGDLVMLQSEAGTMLTIEDSGTVSNSGTAANFIGISDSGNVSADNLTMTNSGSVTGYTGVKINAGGSLTVAGMVLNNTGVYGTYTGADNAGTAQIDGEFTLNNTAASGGSYTGLVNRGSDSTFSSSTVTFTVSQGASFNLTNSTANSGAYVAVDNSGSLVLVEGTSDGGRLIASNSGGFSGYTGMINHSALVQAGSVTAGKGSEFRFTNTASSGSGSFVGFRNLSAADINGVFTVNNQGTASLTGFTGLENSAGNATFTAGADSALTFSNASGLSGAFTGVRVSAGSAVFNGNMAVANSGAVTNLYGINNAGTVDIKATALFTLTNSGAVTNLYGINNAGTANVKGAVELTNSGAVTNLYGINNAGTFNLNPGAVFIVDTRAGSATALYGLYNTGSAYLTGRTGDLSENGSTQLTVYATDRTGSNPVGKAETFVGIYNDASAAALELTGGVTVTLDFITPSGIGIQSLSESGFVFGGQDQEADVYAAPILQNYHGDLAVYSSDDLNNIGIGFDVKAVDWTTVNGTIRGFRLALSGDSSTAVSDITARITPHYLIMDCNMGLEVNLVVTAKPGDTGTGGKYETIDLALDYVESQAAQQNGLFGYRISFAMDQYNRTNWNHAVTVNSAHGDLAALFEINGNDYVYTHGDTTDIHDDSMTQIIVNSDLTFAAGSGEAISLAMNNISFLVASGATLTVSAADATATMEMVFTGDGIEYQIDDAQRTTVSKYISPGIELNGGSLTVTNAAIINNAGSSVAADNTVTAVAVYGAGSVSMTNSTLTVNGESVKTYGIYNDSGSVRLSNASVISVKSTGSDSAAIYNGGALKVGYDEAGTKINNDRSMIVMTGGTGSSYAIQNLGTSDIHDSYVVASGTGSIGIYNGNNGTVNFIVDSTPDSYLTAGMLNEKLAQSQDVMGDYSRMIYSITGGKYAVYNQNMFHSEAVDRYFDGTVGDVTFEWAPVAAINGNILNLYKASGSTNAFEFTNMTINGNVQLVGNAEVTWDNFYLNGNLFNEGNKLTLTGDFMSAHPLTISTGSNTYSGSYAGSIKVVNRPYKLGTAGSIQFGDQNQAASVEFDPNRTYEFFNYSGEMSLYNFTNLSSANAPVSIYNSDQFVMDNDTTSSEAAYDLYVKSIKYSDVTTYGSRASYNHISEAISSDSAAARMLNEQSALGVSDAGIINFNSWLPSQDYPADADMTLRDLNIRNTQNASVAVTNFAGKLTVERGSLQSTYSGLDALVKVHDVYSNSGADIRWYVVTPETTLTDVVKIAGSAYSIRNSGHLTLDGKTVDNPSDVGTLLTNDVDFPTLYSGNYIALGNNTFNTSLHEHYESTSNVKNRLTVTGYSGVQSVSETYTLASQSSSPLSPSAFKLYYLNASDMESMTTVDHSTYDSTTTSSSNNVTITDWYYGSYSPNGADGHLVSAYAVVSNVAFQAQASTGTNTAIQNFGEIVVSGINAATDYQFSGFDRSIDNGFTTFWTGTVSHVTITADVEIGFDVPAASIFTSDNDSTFSIGQLTLRGVAETKTFAAGDKVTFADDAKEYTWDGTQWKDASGSTKTFASGDKVTFNDADYWYDGTEWNNGIYSGRMTIAGAKYVVYQSQLLTLVNFSVETSGGGDAIENNGALYVFNGVGSLQNGWKGGSNASITAEGGTAIINRGFLLMFNGAILNSKVAIDQRSDGQMAVVNSTLFDNDTAIISAAGSPGSSANAMNLVVADTTIVSTKDGSVGIRLKNANGQLDIANSIILVKGGTGLDNSVDATVNQYDSKNIIGDSTTTPDLMQKVYNSDFSTISARFDADKNVLYLADNSSALTGGVSAGYSIDGRTLVFAFNQSTASDVMITWDKDGDLRKGQIGSFVLTGTPVAKPVLVTTLADSYNVSAGKYSLRYVLDWLQGKNNISKSTTVVFDWEQLAAEAGGTDLTLTVSGDPLNIASGNEAGITAITIDLAAAGYQIPAGYTLAIDGSAATGSIFTVSGMNVTLNGGESGLTITGPSASTADGAVFNLANAAGTKLTLNNVTVTGSTTSGNGGAVYVGGVNATLTATGTTFSNNTAANGGAIYNNGGTVSVQNSTLSGNTATDTSAVYNNGGAIYNNGGAVSVQNSTLSDNTATNGGAIYNDGGTVAVIGDMTGNSATNGGAVYLANGSVSVQGNLSDNTATNGGSVIYQTGGSAQIGELNNNFEITGNTGSAFYQDGGDLLLLNTVLTGNTDLFNVQSGTVTLLNSTAYDNTGYVLTQAGGTMQIGDSTIYQPGSAMTTASAGTLNIVNSIINVSNDLNPAFDQYNLINVDPSTVFEMVAGMPKIDEATQTLVIKIDGEAMSGGALVGYTGVTDTTPATEVYYSENGTDWQSVSGTAGTPTVTITLGQNLGERKLDSVIIGAYSIDPSSIFSLTVTTSEDTIDWTDGKTSLREALIYADRLHEEDGRVSTVTFSVDNVELGDQGTITLDGSANLSGNVTISASDAFTGDTLLTVTDDTSLSGQTIAATDGVRGITLNNGHLSLNDVTIRDANVTGNGGAIYAAHGLVAGTNVSLVNNTAADGAAIYSENAPVNLNGFLLKDNTATAGSVITSQLATTGSEMAVSMRSGTISGNISTGNTISAENGSASMIQVTAMNNTLGQSLLSAKSADIVNSSLTGDPQDDSALVSVTDDLNVANSVITTSSPGVTSVEAGTLKSAYSIYSGSPAFSENVENSTGYSTGSVFSGVSNGQLVISENSPAAMGVWTQYDPNTRAISYSVRPEDIWTESYSPEYMTWRYLGGGSAAYNPLLLVGGTGYPSTGAYSLTSGMNRPDSGPGVNTGLIDPSFNGGFGTDWGYNSVVNGYWQDLQSLSLDSGMSWYATMLADLFGYRFSQRGSIMVLGEIPSEELDLSVDGVQGDFDEFQEAPYRADDGSPLSPEEQADLLKSITLNRRQPEDTLNLSETVHQQVASSLRSAELFKDSFDKALESLLGQDA